MAEYIEREALKKAMEFVTNDTTCPIHIAAYIDQIIAQEPAADVVEVVRCKDCKHCTIYRCSADGGIKQIRCHYDIGTYDEDFYCPLGEKMDGKGE